MPRNVIMDRYKDILPPLPYKRAKIRFAIGIIGILIIIISGFSAYIIFNILALVMLIVCPIAFLLCFVHLRNGKLYSKTIKTAADNNINPTWGYGKSSYLLVDTDKKMLVCDGDLFLFDEIKTISQRVTDTTRLRNLPSSVNKLWIVGRDGRITVMLCESEMDATSVFVRLCEDIGMEYH